MKLQKRFAFLVNFVQRHKVALAVGVTSAVFVAMIMRNQKALNEFLKEHNLLDEYYALNES
jgi:hypothetical protein